MHHHQSPTDQAKGWLVGPWNSLVPVPIGYANTGIADCHYHQQMYEIYLVARGTTKALVDGHSVTLAAGDVLVIEPGEVHTFVESSADYFHFVVQTPFIVGDKVTV
ncbi:MAG: cupin domain-containing protein [Caldilineaceae bacterium]|nr:cupin domain-containing protein [Caldilineaceae bacterium]